MQNRVTTFQYKNTKNQRVILNFQRYKTYLLIYLVFRLKNDDTVPNALKINKFLETNVVQNCANGLTIHPPVACFSSAETPESESAKNMQLKI